MQEFQSEASDVISQDDDDEVEELQNSLREAVQDQSVKPKLQCLMVDPSFSMVTVQKEPKMEEYNKEKTKTEEAKIEEYNKEITKTEEPKMEEADVGKDFYSAVSEVNQGTVIKTEEERKEQQLSAVTQETAEREAPEDLPQEPKAVEEQMEHQQVQHEVKTEQMEPAEPPEPGTGKPPETHQLDTQLEETHESKEKQRGDESSFEQNATDTSEADKMPEVLVMSTEEAALIVPVSNEAPGENTERILSEEAANDSQILAADDKVLTEADAKASSKVEEPETALHSLSEARTEVRTAEEEPQCEAIKAAPEDAPSVEVVPDCEMQTVVEVTEKAVSDVEIQTQVKIDLQEVTCVEATADPERGQDYQPLREETEEAVMPLRPAEAADADQESEVKTEIEPATPEKVQPESQIPEAEKQQRELTDCESEKPEKAPEDLSKPPPEDAGAASKDTVTVGDELILLVPKGQAIEMDIEIGEKSEKTQKEATAVPEPDSTRELQVPESEVLIKEVEPILNYVSTEQPPSAHVEEAGAEAEEMVLELDDEKAVLSTLRSFTPQEDLSCLHKDEVQSEDVDVEQKKLMHEIENIPEEKVFEEDGVPYIDQRSEDVEQNKKQDEEVLEAPGEPIHELGYEVISERDAEDMPEMEAQKNAKESNQKQGETIEMEIEKGKDQKIDFFAEEEPIEEDYEIIDAEEEREARLAAELQGMDWFCVTCGCLLSEESRSQEHQSHEVNSVDKAYEGIKETLGVWISELQERSENIEDLVSELELAYNSVEDQFAQSEAAMRAQNEEMMALVMEQYNKMSVSMEEEKKAKLEQLYDKIVSFQENIESAKTTLETAARETETDARPHEDIHARLKAALDSVLFLELGPKGLLVFEDYAKPNTSGSNLEQRKGIAVPQRPTLQPQEPGSATSTSVTVYWRVNPGDIIDCFQVYCMGDPQGAVSEEYRVTVKESYCVLEELEPDKMYKVWVMAVNYTGCSLPSERLVFRTAPSVPVIDTERCTVLWDAAMLRWIPTKHTPGQSYTLEYCRQYELEGEGLRSVSGITDCEQRVLLQPNENYLFYIKAVNEAGASEQSEAALISTKGTKFHLLKTSAHPALELSEDQNLLHCSPEAYESTTSSDKVCPSILGELLPARGLYYWETVVSGSAAYRLGVASSTANRNSPLGENSSSWCLQCTPTASGCRYQLLHSDMQSVVCVTETPERVGTLLNYQTGRLSFYNAQSGQLLGAFGGGLRLPGHPALVLEQPGSLQLCLVPEVPEFTRDS
ncbi:unnamed protein product [Menidia menidia]|uniref:(Atlantic silverside) hypothetical protein n=1 Tax=Menidia menidia TaxID=238744 RepID=A0A8S4AWF1_9TELE|nr:unnamed protein product [Menidia menidia]